MSRVGAGVFVTACRCSVARAKAPRSHGRDGDEGKLYDWILEELLADRISKVLPLAVIFQNAQ
jgi:hypothetical protein